MRRVSVYLAGSHRRNTKSGLGGRRAGSRAMLINRRANSLYLQKKNLAGNSTSGAENVESSHGRKPSSCCCSVFCSTTENHWSLPLKHCACPFHQEEGIPVLRTFEMGVTSGLKYRRSFLYSFGVRESATSEICFS